MQFYSALIAILATVPWGANAAAIDLDARQLGSRPATATAPIPNDRVFALALLGITNKYRAQHAAVNYVYNNTLAQYALVQANKCALVHSGGPYSENIYWTSPAALNFTQATLDAVNSWMSEEPNYVLTDPQHPPTDALHYTALMWKSSTQIGCAWTSQTCTTNGGGHYFFCEMYPQGNVVPLFAQNVQN